MKQPHTALKKWASVLLLTVLLIAGAGLIAQRSSYAQDSSATPAADDVIEPVSLYGLVEFSFSLDRTYGNPYDPDVIAVIAAFHPPDGETRDVPGFYIRPYHDTCAPDCPAEWRVRFAPDQIGHWTYTIEARDADGPRTIRQGAFEVIASDNPGSVRIGPNPRYFAFESGSAYFPVGVNLEWSPAGDSYESWLDDFSAAGINYVRLDIDTPGLDAGAFQVAAWRLDTLLQMAEARGIYLQIILISSGNDPLLASSAAFTDDDTARLIKQRIRYIVARWGYSPHIFAWELVDALDEIPGYTPTRAEPWLADLTQYMREIDPCDHLITVGAQNPDRAFWSSVDHDFAQARFDQPSAPVDQVAGVLDALNDIFGYFDGPVLLTEFALNQNEPTNALDPTGVHIHNTIWAAAASGAAGAAMPWWSENEYPFSLFEPLAQFARDIPWQTADPDPIPVHLVSSAPVTYEPLRKDDFNRRFLDIPSPDVVYQLTADGWLPPAQHASAYLYGTANPGYSRPLTFTVAPPVDTELSIHIESVSAKAPAALTVIVDGREAVSVDLSPASYNIVVTVPVSGGVHMVTLDNPGEEWLQLGYVEVASYIMPLRALALADRTHGTLIAWIHNREYTWQNVAAGKAPTALDADLRVPAMPIGVYRVAFWDTVTGAVIGEEQITLNEASGGVLRIKLLPIASQLAVRAFRIAGPPVESTPGYSTRTPLPTHTATATAPPTATDTPTSEPTDTRTPTATPSHTPTATQTPSRTPTSTHTATATPSRTPSPTPSVTPSPTLTLPPSPTPLVPDMD